MALTDKKRQQKLAKKKQKRAATVQKSPTLSMKKAKAYSACPIHECWMVSNLFEGGIGEVIVARRAPNGNIAMGSFMLDVFCLGVKDALFHVSSEYEYQEIIDSLFSNRGRAAEKIHQSCAKKIVEGAMNYAKELGFPPHPDYANVKDILAGIDSDACPVKYTFGKEGKPFYANGPYESEAKIKKIIDTLTKKCGKGNFGVMLVDGDYDDDDEDYADEYEDDDLGQHIRLTYAITDEPLPDNKMNQLPKFARDEIKDLHHTIRNKLSKTNAKHVIHRLKELMVQYPQIDSLANLLTVTYQLTDDPDLEQTIEEIYKERPNYLFARIEYAKLCLKRGELDKIKDEVFKEGSDLKLLYPDREVFHISELIALSMFNYDYFMAIGKNEAANVIVKMMNDVAPDHPATKRLNESEEMSLFGNLLETILKRQKPKNISPIFKA